MTIAPVIFSGHNDRAVVALCRFFSAQERSFFIIASNEADAIWQTEWRRHVLMLRSDSTLSVPLMAQVASAVLEEGYEPALCPSSEFLNRFVLAHQLVMQSQGWHWVLPSAQVYAALSDKSSSPSIIQALSGLSLPAIQPYGAWRAPCVLKPCANIGQGVVLYPKLCPGSVELESARQEIDAAQWFSQDWVEGQSLYLCAYLDRWGHWDGFWQENLLQQPGGKSIVLARTCANPGLDTSALMQGLHGMGYHGAFMMEVIRDQAQRLHFIEVNPRFWGPLDLARRACPSLLQRFLSDMDGRPMPTHSEEASSEQYYAWAFGAKQGDCRVYPAAEPLQAHWQQLLQAHDVYGQADTRALFNQH